MLIRIKITKIIWNNEKNEVLRCKNIKPEQLQNVYAELCSIIGVEATLKLYSSYKGQQVSFPQRLYAKGVCR